MSSASGDTRRRSARLVPGHDGVRASRSCSPERVRVRRPSQLLGTAALAFSVSFSMSRGAAATYSIVASDRVTQQLGGAGTSCLGGSDVYIIYGSVPGVGVVHAQALFNGAARQRAVQLLASGQSPAQVISAITDPAFDARAAARQYAVVDVSGRSAAFTGADAQSFAADVQGQVSAFTYSVQGNILTSSAVLSQAAQAFEANGCDLAERLMAGLAAGARGGEGDSRCSASGIPSDSAFLQVDAPDSEPGSFLSLRVPSSGTQDPLALLADLFAEWRSWNPCPVSVPDAGGATRPGAVDASTSLPLPSEAAAPASSNPDASSTALGTPSPKVDASPPDVAEGTLPDRAPPLESSGSSCTIFSGERPGRPSLVLGLLLAGAVVGRRCLCPVAGRKKLAHAGHG
jgi:uncharacterized Ntn-hydrolase superfamily protein